MSFFPSLPNFHYCWMSRANVVGIHGFSPIYLFVFLCDFDFSHIQRSCRFTIFLFWQSGRSKSSGKHTHTERASTFCMPARVQIIFVLCEWNILFSLGVPRQQRLLINIEKIVWMYGTYTLLCAKWQRKLYCCYCCFVMTERGRKKYIKIYRTIALRHPATYTLHSSQTSPRSRSTLSNCCVLVCCVSDVCLLLSFLF